jgi:hypothetical protein
LGWWNVSQKAPLNWDSIHRFLKVLKKWVRSIITRWNGVAIGFQECWSEHLIKQLQTAKLILIQGLENCVCESRNHRPVSRAVDQTRSEKEQNHWRNLLLRNWRFIVRWINAVPGSAKVVCHFVINLSILMPFYFCYWSWWDSWWEYWKISFVSQDISTFIFWHWHSIYEEFIFVRY